jgi:phosphoenolpyruvate carboxylase
MEHDAATAPADLRHLETPLRADVRLLGRMLGEVIAADRGEAFLGRIETIRALAKEARTGRPDGWARLSGRSTSSSTSRTSLSSTTSPDRIGIAR